jgi:hypothetical protein
MGDNMQYKLGRNWRKGDPRTLYASKYMKSLPPPPPQAGYIDKVASWPMMLNDSLGDCTCAAAGHMIEQWTTYANNPIVPTDAQILQAYEVVGGYKPNDPSTDNGAVMLDVLKYWKKVGIGGHKIAGYVALNPKNHTQMKQAIALFGNVYIGVALPLTAQTPVVGESGYPCWSLPPGGPIGNGLPYSWGGHCIPLVGYGVDSRGQAGTRLVTWGQVYDATWGFLDLYCDEAWAVVSQDWIDAQGKSPSGFDLYSLLADLAQVTSA